MTSERQKKNYKKTKKNKKQKKKKTLTKTLYLTFSITQGLLYEHIQNHFFPINCFSTCLKCSFAHFLLYFMVTELGKLFPSIPLVAEEDSAFLRSNNLADLVVNAVTDKARFGDKKLTRDDVLGAIDRGGKDAFTFGANPATYWVGLSKLLRKPQSIPDNLRVFFFLSLFP